MAKRNSTAKRRMRRMKRKPELIRTTFYCPVLDRAVDIDGEDINFHGESCPCDMCGSHSEVIVSFICECGDHHYIKIYDD